MLRFTGYKDGNEWYIDVTNKTVNVTWYCNDLIIKQFLIYDLEKNTRDKHLEKCFSFGGDFVIVRDISALKDVIDYLINFAYSYDNEYYLETRHIITGKSVENYTGNIF